MKNVSSQFRNELNNGNRRYVRNVKITLKDGSIVNISNKNLWQNGLKLETAVSGESSFDLGSVIIGQLTLVLNNIEEEYSKYDFTDCVANDVKVGLELNDGTIESLGYGKFYLNEANYNGSIITLSFYDCIYKFDKAYSESKLSYPTTLGQIVRDACEVCGVTLGTPTFEYDDYVVDSRPDDESITFRQILQWVGQISCHYFYSDPQGRLAIGWYDTDTLESIGTKIEESPLGDTLGEDILDYQNQQIMTLREVQDFSQPDPDASGDYQKISSFATFSVGLDDVVITGIRVLQEIEGESGTETITYQAGTDGYVLEISGNKLIQGEKGNIVASQVGEKLIGVRFRTFSASSLSDPTIESGDIVLLVDRKNRKYKSLITNNTFQPGSYQNVSCGAESPARKSAARYSQITQVYVDYRRELGKERTEREQALSDLGDRINNSSGLFTTIEEQPDGSKKYFLHNKPSIEDSDIIWSMTSEAWGVSTDGGKTQNAGMTVDGDTIVRILTAVGVNADWIKTGAFRIEKDGQVMFNADTETGRIDIVANSFSLRGLTIEEIADQQLDNFVDSVLGPTLDNLQNQIDGQIETYYYDYEPTLDNEPASEWTTEEERKRHEGDLFYWKSKGYSYRFLKDNDTWKWQMVQDTDITKALQQAAEAQDTADQKRRVFTATPNPPYDIGDLWVQGIDGDIMKCQTARKSGNYVSSDWVKASKYTDDSAVEDLDESLDMQGVFNRLTDNGKQQGLFIENGTLYMNAGYVVTGILASKDGKSSWNLDTGVLIVGDEDSRINAGILQSPNFEPLSSGIQINLNSGVVQGEIEATSLSAKDNIKLYNDGKEHIFVTGNYSTDGMIITTIGCDLENFSTSQTPIPSIVLNKSGSTGVVAINAGSIGLNGSVSTGYLATSDINAAGNVSLTGKLIADSASITNIISAYGFDGGWIIESGNRMRVDWRQNSAGVWTLYFYIDDQLVRTW